MSPKISASLRADLGVVTISRLKAGSMARDLALSSGEAIMAVGLLVRGKMAAASFDMDALDRRLATLMRAAQDGDRRAYADLLHDCAPVIRRAARKAGLTGDWIEDALQETLLTLHNARQTYDPSRSFIAWISVIARRRAIDILRRTSRNARREVHAPIVYEQHADPGADAASGWEATGRAGELRAAISGLSASQREAIEHLGLREQSLAEASAETGKTTGALKVNLHRALKALRGKLAGGGDG